MTLFVIIKIIGVSGKILKYILLSIHEKYIYALTKILDGKKLKKIVASSFEKYL